MTTWLKFTFAAACATLLANFAAHASYGQHYHGGGHFHYQPGHYHHHYDHYDYHPPRVTYHPQEFVPAPTYYGAEGHSHEHSRPSHRPVFGAFSHIDELTMRLEREANLVCLELHYNYQHNPGFAQTYREAYEILTTAKYIHGLEHSGNRARLKQAAEELDALFHHVQSDVVHWTAHHHRHVGVGGLGYKLDALESTLHHLMDDMGVRTKYANAPDGADVLLDSPAAAFQIGD